MNKDEYDTHFLYFVVVMIENYEGYWKRKQEETLVFCSKGKPPGTILNCEIEDCITNCRATYVIQNVEIISQRDSNDKGRYEWNEGIRWSNNITWTKKG